MADEKSIYERWSEERLDPPFPKEWGLDEEDEAELLWPIWPLLFMGESDTEQYVETITDYVMDVLGLEYDGENEDSKLWEKRVEDYVDELIKRRRAFAAELGITPEMQKNSNLNSAFAAQKEEISALHEKLSVQLLRETVIPVLEKHGLSVKWNGNYNTRPYIDGVEVYNIP